MARKIRKTADFKVTTAGKLGVLSIKGLASHSTHWDREMVTKLSGVSTLPRRYTVRYTEDPKGDIRYSNAYCTYIEQSDIHWNACFLSVEGFKDGIKVKREILFKA